MKKILIPLLLLVVACNGPRPSRPSNNLEVVIREYPNAIIYSEKPNNNLQDWIILKDNQIYSVHVYDMTVEYTYLLSIRYDPNNKSDTTQRINTKVDTLVDTIF